MEQIDNSIEEKPYYQYEQQYQNQTMESRMSEIKNFSIDEKLYTNIEQIFPNISRLDKQIMKVILFNLEKLNCINIENAITIKQFQQKDQFDLDLRVIKSSNKLYQYQLAELKEYTDELIEKDMGDFCESTDKIPKNQLRECLKILFQQGYKVNKILSKSGAEGVVFQGYQLHTKEKVALKIQFHEEKEFNSKENFKRQVFYDYYKQSKIMGLLKNSIHSIKLIDQFLIEKYLIIVQILELCESDLEQFINELKTNNRFLNYKEIMQIMPNLLDPLIELQSYSIIHSDIKPSNILYQRCDQKYFIADFGVSKIIDQKRKNDIPFIDGGTKFYSSPEQFECLNKMDDKELYSKLHFKSDVFSMGLVLLQLMGCQLNLQATNSLRLGKWPDNIYENVQDKEKLKSLITFVQCYMLNTNQQIRKSSMQLYILLMKSQKKYFHGQINQFKEQIKRKIQLNEQNIKYLSYLYFQLGCMGEDQEENYKKALKLAKESEESDSEDYLYMLNSYGNYLIENKKYEEGGRILNDCLIQRVQVKPALNSAIAESYHDIAKYYQIKGNIKKALQYYNQSLQIRKDIYEVHPELVESLNGKGEVLIHFGQFIEAKECFQQSLRLIEIMYSPNHHEIDYILNTLGMIELKLGNYQASLDLIAKAYDMKLKLFDQNDPEMAYSHNQLGFISCIYGNYQLSEKLFNKTQEIRKKNKTNLKHYAQETMNIGNLQGKLGQFKKQKISYYQSLITLKQIYLNENIYFAELYYHFGKLYLNLGDYQQALKNLETALNLNQKYFKESHPNTAACLNLIGAVKGKLGNYSEQYDYCQKALNMRKQMETLNLIDCAGSHYSLAISYINLGQYKLAQQSAQEALEKREQIFKQLDDHPQIANSLNILGVANMKIGELESSYKQFNRALQIREKQLPNNHPDIAESLNNLGILFRIQKQYSKAKEYVLKALKIKQCTFSLDHPTFIISYQTIGECYKSHKIALEYFQKALDLCNRLYQGDHPDKAATLNNIGFYYESQRFPIKKSKQSLITDNKVYSIEKYFRNNQFGDELNFLQFKKHNFEKALFFYKKAIQMRKNVLDKNHPDLIKSLQHQSFIEDGLVKLNLKSMQLMVLESKIKSIIFNTVFHISILKNKGIKNHKIIKQFGQTKILNVLVKKQQNLCIYKKYGYQIEREAIESFNIFQNNMLKNKITNFNNQQKKNIIAKLLVNHQFLGAQDQICINNKEVFQQLTKQIREKQESFKIKPNLYCCQFKNFLKGQNYLENISTIIDDDLNVKYEFQVKCIMIIRKNSYLEIAFSETKNLIQSQLCYQCSAQIIENKLQVLIHNQNDLGDKQITCIQCQSKSIYLEIPNHKFEYIISSIQISQILKCQINYKDKSEQHYELLNYQNQSKGILFSYFDRIYLYCSYDIRFFYSEFWSDLKDKESLNQNSLCKIESQYIEQYKEIEMMLIYQQLSVESQNQENIYPKYQILFIIINRVICKTSILNSKKKGDDILLPKHDCHLDNIVSVKDQSFRGQFLDLEGFSKVNLCSQQINFRNYFKFEKSSCQKFCKFIENKIKVSFQIFNQQLKEQFVFIFKEFTQQQQKWCKFLKNLSNSILKHIYYSQNQSLKIRQGIVLNKIVLKYNKQLEDKQEILIQNNQNQIKESQKRNSDHIEQLKQIEDTIAKKDILQCLPQGFEIKNQRDGLYMARQIKYLFNKSNMDIELKNVEKIFLILYQLFELIKFIQEKQLIEILVFLQQTVTHQIKEIGCQIIFKIIISY